MLLVKTYLDKSKIHGIGLFADELIKKGTLIWKFVPGFDFVLNKKQLKTFPKVAKRWILKYGYFDKDEKLYYICVDDARFFNHSENSNTEDKDLGTVAARNINKGEEITCNYYDFDAEFKLKIDSQ